MDNYPTHFTIVVADIERFSSRDDGMQEYVRRSFYELCRKAFEAAGVPWPQVRPRHTGDGDRGDGSVFLVPAAIPKVRVVEDFVERLHAALRRHNRRASADACIRLRVAIHAGEVTQDDEGRSGADTIIACRLVDTPVSRTVLAAAERAALVLIVSDVIYQGTVRHRLGAIDPTTYEPVHVEVKEMSRGAWIHVPGYSTPPGLTAADHAAPTPSGGDRAAGSAARSGPAGTPAAGGVWVQTVEGDFVQGIQIKQAAAGAPREGNDR